MLLLFALLAAWLRGQPANAPPAATANTDLTRPEVTIPVGPLGYLPPGELPAFYYYALVELHFIDADHLMFAFNVPALLKRDDNCPTSESQRMVRAVVLQLPSGHVLKRVDWELYDFADFLWGLDNGQLLLRRCNQLETVDADLQLRPLIEATGTIEDVGFSPDRSIAVVEEKAAPSAEDKNSGAFPSILAEGTVAQRTNVNFIRLHPPQMIARAEIPVPSEIPVTSTGIFEALTAPRDQWVVNLQVFQGTQQHVGAIHSVCPPAIRPITDNVLLATTCPKGNERVFQGYNLQGSLLWEIPRPPDQYLPELVNIPKGAHFAIESLRLKRPHAALDPLTKDDVVGEDIDIYDTLSGIRIATFQTTPVYTGGRNVDFSPDGSRMAVLRDGAIEIYDLANLEKAQPSAPR
ncbi:MAG: hypothetical protein ACYCOR_18835 [Acidobacteriaceae bacterium]